MNNCNWGEKLRVGDSGQRYEIVAINRESGKEEVLGWTEKPDGGGIMAMAKLWPAYRDPKVRDRGAIGDLV